jgi:luciferase family oxidoreductase group 1
MIPFSVLDLAPIIEGGDAKLALDNSRDLARHVEALGYRRFWLAEHHNMPGIASAATAVAIGYVAAVTSTIRVGAGGIMLPNHAPLIIAEQFGTLAALYPGRIDLGLGRAPGTDQLTAQALRRHLPGADTFPQDVVELLHYFEPAEPNQAVRAIPGAGLQVEVWILGSSLFGAQLAAALGLPYAFASHFAPDLLDEALAVYRARFRPSKYLAQPYAMVGCNLFAADTDEEARLLATSMMQSFIALRSGRPGLLPPPDASFERRAGAIERAMIDERLSVSAVGSRESVRAALERILARTRADELMLTGMIYDHAARKKSFAIAAELRESLRVPA